MSTFTEEWLTGPGGTEFYTCTYKPSSTVNAVLVFVHGFIEHIGRYTDTFQSYSESGIAVFAFDQRGFGKTALDPGPDGARKKARASRNEGYGRTSSQQQREDICWAVKHAHAIEWTDGSSKVPVFLMGHSMGGALVLSIGSDTPSSLPALAGIISTSPLIAQAHPAAKITRKVGGLASALLPWNTVPAGINPDQLSHDKAIGEAYMKDPLIQFYGTLKGISTMLNLGDNLSATGYKTWPEDLPVLFAHGTADEITSFATTEKFSENIRAKDKTFSSFQGGFHELHNEPELKSRLLNEVKTWIMKHTAAVAVDSKL
ncbi:alpha beta-hydrolase [Hysterangium stoloniferum]|nr:alpha beta-hydrolase [Hysterangium stoloniferum]